MSQRLGISLAAACLIASAAPAAASVTVNIRQVGANVVATTTGTLDVTGLEDDGEYILDSAVAGGFAYIGTGTQDDLVEGYFGSTSTVVGPDSWGPGGFVAADSGSGTPFAFNYGGFGEPYVFVPEGYAGTALASTSTFNNTTLAALGLNVGRYAYTLPADTVTVNIGGSAVPEPASWALMLGGFGFAGTALRRARRTTVSYA